MQDSLAGELADMLDGEETAAESGQEQPKAYFANVWDFVYRWLRHMYKRRVSGNAARWSSTWFDCPEAVSRLTELWRVWEISRRDETTGMAVWWRDYCDPTMDRLMSETGPFADCEVNGRSTDPLPCALPPAGRFRDERTGEAYVIPADDGVI
ncbi:DUF4913 domain-containing protein [Bifidobacterium xylocopae]|uniref:DUF4913 domain-containing protein n=2 Tax=Bifidobacterium xylocopae TaxID=2493119 RepID=A0A366KDS6_9BIFI|nr:DUF4913 domain-containing protein [Bifidobacterium xylocopae]